MRGVGCLEMGGFFMLYWYFSRDSSWCSIGKNYNMFYLSFVNKHTCYNAIAQIKYEMIGIVIVLVVLILL